MSSPILGAAREQAFLLVGKKKKDKFTPPAHKPLVPAMPMGQVGTEGQRIPLVRRRGHEANAYLGNQSTGFPGQAKKPNKGNCSIMKNRQLDSIKRLSQQPA